MTSTILGFIANPTVQSTALITMAITALLAALPKPGTISIKNFVDFIAMLYKFFYDWATGFWSMKTGQKPTDPTPPVAPGPSLPYPTQKL